MSQELEQLRERTQGLEKEQEDLLVFLADQDAEAKRMRKRLRELGEDIPKSDDEEEEEEAET